MEQWRRCFRNGFAPLLSLTELDALERGLIGNDSRLIQGASTSPPASRGVDTWPCEGACLIAYAGWQGGGLVTVAEVEEFFVRVCCEVERRLGEIAGTRHLLQWFDDSPRDEMRAALLPEVQEELRRRGAVA